MPPYVFTNLLNKGNKIEYNGECYKVAKNICGSTILIGEKGELVTVSTRDLQKTSIHTYYEKQIANCENRIEELKFENKKLQTLQDLDKKNRSINAEKLALFKRKNTWGDINNGKKDEYNNLKNNYWENIFSYTEHSNDENSNLSLIRMLTESISFYKS